MLFKQIERKHHQNIANNDVKTWCVLEEKEETTGISHGVSTRSYENIHFDGFGNEAVIFVNIFLITELNFVSFPNNMSGF